MLFHNLYFVNRNRLKFKLHLDSNWFAFIKEFVKEKAFSFPLSCVGRNPPPAQPVFRPLPHVQPISRPISWCRDPLSSAVPRLPGLCAALLSASARQRPLPPRCPLPCVAPPAYMDPMLKM
jgi:hypothetical protein